MKISFHGAAGTVTGSCYEVVTPDIRFLVDCGMFQGEAEALNHRRFPFNPSELDYVLLTHAHIDHAGLIPKLVKEGFEGTILCTGATLDLCRILLPDSGHIQEQEAEWRGRRGPRQGLPPFKPIYDETEARQALSFLKAIKYGEEVELSDSTRVVYKDAGHILGSAFIELEVRENGYTNRIAFSGDLGNAGQPIIRDPEYPSSEFDMVLLESTYGDRDHKALEDRPRELAEVINGTIRRGGNVVIPSFAVGRTQDVVYEILRLSREGRIPKAPIFIDSPLATSATEIYQRHTECFDPETMDLLKGLPELFHSREVRFVRDAEESRSLNKVKGAILIASSGMCEVGRIVHHLKHNLWRPESSIVFVGYQAQGTLGRRILSGTGEVTIFGEPILVKADIVSIGSFSAHADQSGLLAWLERIRRVGALCLVHGEPQAQEVFASAIKEKLGITPLLPTLDSGASLHEGKVTLSEGKNLHETIGKTAHHKTAVASGLRSLAERVASGTASEHEMELAGRILNA